MANDDGDFKNAFKRIEDYFKNMVINRNGHNVHSYVKEPTYTKKPITKRISELPSLRYGIIGSKNMVTGPLRVSSNNNFNTLPRTSLRKTTGRAYASDDLCCKPVRPPRRVRFTLPATDGDASPAGDDSSSVAGVAGGPKAGEGWLRTRFSAASQKYSIRRSESADRVKSLPLHAFEKHLEGTSVPVTASPGARNRIHPTGRYIKGTLSPTANATPHAAVSPEGQALLRAARDGDDQTLGELLHRAALVGVANNDLNAVDSSGRTILSYIASNGSIDLLEQIIQFPGLDSNKADNEGNTPLHFVAQAGQLECLNCMLSRCRGIDIDAKNNLGFTPLMKAALQGRNKCAKLLLFAGANPTLRDNGRGFRADQWARFCGRYVCADIIEKHARQRLLERTTSYGNWGGDHELAARVLMGKVVPMPQMPQQSSHGIKSKLRKVFRTSSGPSNHSDAYSSARLVTQLTSAALCASSPVLPSGPAVPRVIKSLIRPLTVPRLQITLVHNNADYLNQSLSNGVTKPNTAPTSTQSFENKQPPVVKPARMKKKK